MNQPLYAIDLDLQGADLSGGPFTECWFCRSDLRGATLRGTVFWAAHCEETLFTSADLSDADFIRAELSGADFTRAVLTRAELGRATGWRTRFVHADLTNAKLLDATFAEADFTGANFTGAVFDKTGLRDATLVGANLTGATGTILGPVTVAPGLCLGGSDLQHWLFQQGLEITVFKLPDAQSSHS